MNYWIGQGFGILATLSDISIPQFKKKWQMLIANIAVNTFSALNLVFLNQIGSGIFLFAGKPLISLYLQGEGDPALAAETLHYCNEYVLIMLIGPDIKIEKAMSLIGKGKR